MREILIRRIEGFARAKGLAPATVTGRAVGNSRLYSRLLAGGDCTTAVAGRLLAWMAEREGTAAEEGRT